MSRPVTRANRRRFFFTRPVARAVASALVAMSAPAWAAPLGEQVTAGQATVQRAGANTVIQQGSERASINWQSFNIGAGESVRFVQPSASSIALNRVLGHNASEIYGSLSANGQVFLLNPHGVLFGRGAQVNVGGLVASTLNLSDADFLAGRYRFVKEGAAGEVRNAGSILADGGYVALLGPRVINEGTVAAANGGVALAAGDQATLNLNGNKLIGLTVDRGALNALTHNQGLVRADGGHVLLSAKAADQLIKSVVNNDGVIEAGTLQRVNGQIHLVGDIVVHNGTLRTQGGDITLAAANEITLAPTSIISAGGARGGNIAVQARAGAVLASGRIEANGHETSGGNVQLLGERVALLNNATVDVSGTTGGGSALIGGDFQGKNPLLQNASRTVVAPGASIKADAITRGDGGKVIVWADDATRYQGNISAQGGAQSGDGGLVEVSGKNTLDFAGAVNTSAANGKFGTLLLDPTNITVVAGATPNPLNAADGLWAFGEDAGNQNIGAGAINTLLTANNLTLQATNNITVSSAISYTGAADRTLTLQANNNVTTSSAISTTAGRLNLVLNADADGSGAGTVAINNGVTTRGGSLTATGFGVTTNTTGTLSTIGAPNLDGGAVTLTAAAGGAVSVNKTINTTGGAASAGSDGRNAGAVNLSGGAVQARTITASGSNGVAAGARAGGAGGSIALDATGAVPTITLQGTITARGGNGVGGGIGGNGGTVSISDPARLNANIAINTRQGTGGTAMGGNVTFGSIVDSATTTARTLSVAAGTGNIVFSGAVGTTQQLQTFAANGRAVTVSAVRTNGSQTYTGTAGTTLTGGTLQAITGTAAAQAVAFAGAGPVILTGATTVQTPGGAADNITFSTTSTINGAHSLTLDAGAAGNVTLGAAAGGSTPLSSIGANGAVISLRAVATTGSQSYSGTGVTLNGNLTSTGTAAADTIAVTGPVTLAGTTTVQTSGAAADGIAFSSTINGARVFIANANQGALSFGGAVGQTTALTSINATGGALAMSAVRAGGITARSTTGNVTLNGVQTATGGGNSVVIAAATNFINNVGAGAIVPGAGRWLVYSTSPAGSTENGLTATAGSAQPRLYNRTFAANPPATITQPGNHLIYSTQPAYTVTADTKSRVYGDANPPLTFTAAGLVVDDGVADTLVNAGITGAPDLSTTAVPNSPVAGSPYTIAAANGTLASTAGYGFALVNGQITVAPRPVTVSATPGQNKIYGNADPVFAFTSTSLGGGDPLAGALARAAGENVGAYAINQGSVTNATNPNYNISFVGNNFNITQRPITVSAAADTKVYDGGIVSTAVPIVSAGSFAFSDTGAFTQTFDNKNAGGGKTLTAGGSVNDGNGGNNYAVTFVTSNGGVIIPASITGVTGVTANSKVYDATTAATLNTAAANFTGIIAGDTLTVAAASGAFTDKNAGVGKTVNISGITLGGADAGNYTLTNPVATASADITPLSITGTITAANKVYDATTAATITGRNLAGVLGGDSVSYSGGTADFADKNAGAGKPVSATGLSLTGADAGNYTVNTTALTTADITALAITGTISAANRVYDATTAATITGRNLSGVLGGDTVTYSGGTATFSDKNAGVGKMVTATGLSLVGADAANYTVITSAVTTANITPASITAVTGITADNKVYDATTVATLATGAATFTGMFAGDTLNVGAASGAFSDKNVGTGKTVNISGITLGGTDAGNYTLASNTATTTANITPAAIANVTGIIANNKVYDATTGATLNTGAANFAGIIAGDNLTVAAAGGAFSDKNAGNNKTVNISGITLGGADAGNYTLTSNTATTTANITPAAIANVTGIIANNKVYDATTAATLNTGAANFTGIIAGDNLTVAGASGTFSDKNAGNNKTVNIGGITLGGADAANYTFGNTTAMTTANITPATLAVAFGGVNKIYDGTTTATVTASDNRFAGDTLTINRSANFSDANAGAGKTVNVGAVNLSGVDAGNYVAAVTGTAVADITPRGIGIAADNASKIYGNTDPALTFSIGGAGLAAGDDAGTVFGGALARTPGENVVGSPYAIAQGTLVPNANYSVTAFSPGQLTITPRALTITADNKTNAAGNPLPPFSASYNGFAFSDTPASLVGTLSFATVATNVSPPGAYAIAPSGQTSSNYAISYLNGTLLVTPGAGLIPPGVLATIYGGNDQLPPRFVSGPVALPTSFAAVQPLNVTGTSVSAVLAQASDGDALTAPGAGGAAAQREAQAQDEQHPLRTGVVKMRVDVIEGGVRMPR